MKKNLTITLSEIVSTQDTDIVVIAVWVIPPTDPDDPVIIIQGVDTDGDGVIDYYVVTLIYSDGTWEAETFTPEQFGNLINPGNIGT